MKRYELQSYHGLFKRRRKRCITGTWKTKPRDNPRFLRWQAILEKKQMNTQMGIKQRGLVIELKEYF
jgi:hypothetical protein